MCSPQSNMGSKLKNFALFAEFMPCVVIIQQLNPFKSIYMNSRGLDDLGTTMKEIRNMGEAYLQRFFNFEDSKDYVEKLQQLIAKNNLDETFTFFQQVKVNGREEWIWHIASTRIYQRDETGKASHVITVAIPVDNMKHIPNKAERLLAEKNFFHTNLSRFLSLGKREREVLKLVATGNNSPEIAHKLCISVQTVNTHRKAIKHKLDISSGYDFTLYAYAFDLI